MSDSPNSAQERAKTAAKTATARHQAKQDIARTRKNAGRAQLLTKKPKPRLKGE